MSLPNQTSELSAKLSIDLTPEESFAGIMLATVAVDGHMAEEELQNLMTTLRRTKLFKHQTKSNIVQTLKKLLKIIKANNVDTLLQLAIPKLPEYLYETIFAIATDLALSDGAMFEEELDILAQLSDKLSISEEKVDQITQVMMIKNKG